LLLGLLLFCHSLSLAQQNWPVPAATMRADLRIDARPEETDAGLLIVLPDGGLLPGRYPVIEARAADGTPLPTQLLWHNPAESLVLVCAVPAAGDSLSLYLQGSGMPPPRPARAPFKPGLLLFTRVGNASLEAARRLPKLWPPAGDGRMGPVESVGNTENPFGPDDDYVSWYSGWFKLDREETIYFATISDEGSELRVDDAVAASWPGLHTRDTGARGEHGAQVKLAAGWHRLDYLHYEAQGPQEMQALWRRASAGALPVLIPPSAYVRCGETSLEALQYRDGRVGAWIEGGAQAGGYLWIGDRPVHHYRLNAQSGSAEGLGFLWEFPGGLVVRGDECRWLTPEGKSCTVTLTSTNRAGATRQRLTLYSGKTPPASSLANEVTRLDYRRTFLEMVRAAPAGSDPAAAWDRDLWATLSALLEPYRGGPILQPLFASGAASIARLPAAERWSLEDRFVESLRLVSDTAPLLTWLARLEQSERDRARRFHWRAERVTALLYDAGETNAARREARMLRDSAGGPDETALALIRQGDVERVSGSPDAATRFYGEAQQRYRERHRPAGDSAAATAAFQSSGGGASAAARPTRNPAPLASRARVEDWKNFTLQDAAFLATIRSQLEQQAVAEAFASLSRWELEAPLSKLGGDYPLAEAQLYAQAGDDRRALSALRASRRGGLMSAALPDLMGLELDALLRLRRESEARALAAEIVKRLEGHPLAKRASELLGRQP
ncbi:MAG: hypothetical protein PHR35_18365, partial [Kiritimatiellae bacterium]|nr:hypothetical protein [Kiritimatiellia bacterium]